MRKVRLIVLGVAALFALVVLGQDASPDVYASPAPGQCTLTRSPVLLPMAMPDDLECMYDEDGNGLDDAIEEEIADCVVPEFRFSEGEPDWSLGPEEPHVVFNSYLDAIHNGDLHIVIQYAAVWAYDGGFATSEGKYFPCDDTDEHAGDTQGFAVTVWVRHTGAGWDVEFESISIDAPERNPDGRVIVYPSAGKHHWYPHADEYEYGCPACCTEYAFGNLTARIPEVEHVPRNIEHLRVEGVLCGEWYWVNACHLRKGEDPQPARKSLRREDLWDWTFPICHFSGGCDDQDETVLPHWWYHIACPDIPHIMDDPFMSPIADGIWKSLTGGSPSDVDNDGLHFWEDPCPAHKPNGIDTDGDGLGSACDPQPDEPNLYVAGGAPGYPALEIGPMAGFLNHPPVCDANGPYFAVSEDPPPTMDMPLDGSASSDPDPGDILTYSWTTDIPSGTFDDATSATPTITVDTGPGSVVDGKVHLDVSDYGGLSDLCYAALGVFDAAGAIEKVVERLTPLADDPNIQAAIDKLQGEQDGNASNGALDMLEKGDLNAALVKIKHALRYLEAAEAADPSLDLTDDKGLLALAAKSVAVEAIAEAEAVAFQPDDLQKIQQAKDLVAEGNTLLAAQDYVGAVDKYQRAVRKVQDIG